MTSIAWLWEGRIPAGCISIIEGDPGVSKSTLTATMAAHVSCGRTWPDGASCPRGRAILCNAEDPEKEVIVPRLVAAGARLEEVSILLPSERVGGEEPFTIPEHIPALEERITGENVKLLVFDPLEEFLSVHVNNYNNHHVRRALHAVSDLARRTRCAVLVIRHLTKDSGKTAIYRGGGSIGIIGAARAALLVSKDPTSPRRFLLVPNKANWAALRDGLAYRTEEVIVSGEGETTVKASKIVWEGEVSLSANEVLQPQEELSEGIDLSDAGVFIREALSKGPLYSTELFARGLKEGFARKVLYRAAKLIGVIKKPAEDRKWIWELPPLEIDSEFIGET